MSSRANGRNDLPVQPGKPASGNRNQRRAYEFQQKKAEEDWSIAREFEERPRQPRKPTTRSQAWKGKRTHQVSKPDDAAASTDFRSKEETSPVDEPLYDLGPHTSSIPVQEVYSQNVDLSGYIDQVERTYEIMRGIDPRLDRRLPFSMFQHSMTTILNCYLLDVALDNGERKLGFSKCQDLLPEDLCMPDNLYHYCTSIGNTTTATGEDIKLNIPDAAIPQGMNDAIPSGTFGPITAHNHNLYECYIAPLVTANRVLNSRRGPNDPEVPPLPADLVPAGGVATRNLLGHGPPDIIPAEARPRITGFDFPDGDSVAARLKICPELMMRVNTVLFELRTRFKMRDIGRTSPGLRNYIIPKHIPGNVRFVYVEENTPDAMKLSYKQNQIRSSSSFGSSSAGQENVHVIHRLRNNNARGLCYTVNNAAPQGWNAHINDNFNMVGDFTATIGVTNPGLRIMKFISYSPGGTRLTAVDNYIKRNYYIPAR